MIAPTETFSMIRQIQVHANLQWKQIQTKENSRSSRPSAKYISEIQSSSDIHSWTLRIMKKIPSTCACLCVLLCLCAPLCVILFNCAFACFDCFDLFPFWTILIDACIITYIGRRCLSLQTIHDSFFQIMLQKKHSKVQAYFKEWL